MERFNRTLIDMLSKFCGERQDDWDQHLPFLMCAYRATVNESTVCTPNLLMLGREVTLPLDLMFPPATHTGYQCHTEYVEWVKRAMQDNFERARHHLGVAASRQKRYYDVRTKNRQYTVGDFVLRFYPPNLRNKLLSPYLGPYRIMSKLGEVTYYIQKGPSDKPVAVHVDHIKPFHLASPPPAWADYMVSEELCSSSSTDTTLTECQNWNNGTNAVVTADTMLRGSGHARRVPAASEHSISCNN